MKKRSKKSWSRLAARVTLGLLVAGGTLGWAQGASAEVETKFKVTGWTDGKPVCDTSASGFGQIKYEIKNYEPMLYGKMDWALSNPTDPIFEVYYASTGGDPLKYTDLGKAVLYGSYAKDATYSANNSKVVVTAGKLASVVGANMIGTGKAEGNIVEILGTAAIADSIGGAVSNGEANNNKVKIDNVNLDTEFVYGASLRNDKGSATENEVEIIGGNVKIKEISGAYAFPVNYANVSRNSVTVKNAVLGAYSRGSSKKIEISGASTASSREDGSYTGKAEENGVVLENVKVSEDSYLSVYGGFGGESVIYNHVTIKDSEIVSAGNSEIIGGFTYGGDVKYNTVTIENSKVKGNVYAATAGAYGVKDVKASAIGNQIILKGTLDLKEAILYGVDKAELAKGHNSNALILDNLTGSNNSTEIRAVKNFNYIQFNTVNLTSDNNIDHAYLKLSDVKSEFLDEKTSLYGSISGTGYLMTGYFDGSKLDVSDLKFLGGSSVQDYLTGNGVKLTGYDVKVGYESLNYNNYVKVENGTSPIALAGVYTDGSGIEHTNTGASTSRAINITSAPASTVKIIAGAYNAAVDSASAKAVNGKVTVSNTKLDNSSNQWDGNVKLYGGFSVNGGAENNQLILENLSYKANYSLRFYGNYATKGDIKSEITAVEVNGGKVYDIYGNYSNMGGNIIGMENVPVVKLTNVTSCGSITGARIQTTDNSNIYKIENNEVLIQYDAGKSGTGATVTGTEGFSNYIAKNNKVTIDGEFTVNNVRGIDQSKEADGNTVTVRNGAVVNNKVYGVYLGKESASNNKVIIDNATVKELVEGASANVKATGNAVEITNGSKVGSVNGFVTGDAENNSISIMGSSVTGEVVGHYYKALATEKNDLSGKQNTIEISNSDVDGNVVGSMILSSDYGSLMSSVQGQGASTLAGTLTENSVTISGTSEVKNATDRYVAGAYINKEYTGVASGDVVKNTVTIKDGAKVAPVIYSGYTIKGNAQNNSVTVQDNAQVTGSIYGNYSMDGNATGDGEHANVSISGGAKFSNTYGGYSKNGQANSNIVQITGEGTTYTGSWGIFGGYSEKDGGEANSNKVVVNGGASISNVFGGSASVASGNIVTIGTAGDTTTVVNGDIWGAGGINLSKNEVNLLGGSINRIWGAFGTIVSENAVTISGGAIREEYSDGYIIGGEAESFSGDTDNIASNNVVNISAGNFNANVAGNVASSGSGIAKGDGTRANVSISGGTVNGNVYGGAGGIAENNIVSISGGTVTGKYAGVIGGSGTTVSGNKISISGGIINSKVTGGVGNNSFDYNTSDLTVNTIINSTVSGNIVEISGGTLGGEQKSDIYAGYSESKTSYKGDAVAKGNIKDNKIIITKDDNFDVATSLVNANLYGSNLAASETSGNTLELKDANLNGLKVNTINNFDNIDFGDLIFANNTTLDKAFVTLSMSDASNLAGTVLYADSINGSGILLTGKFSAKDVTLAGALEATGNKEIVAALDAGGVKVGISTGTKVRFGNDTSSEAIENNYIQLTAGSTTYDKMAGKYIDASGKESGSGTLTLSAAPDAAIKNIAGVYSNDISKVATGGTLNLSGGTYAADVKVYGGYSDGGTVTGNNLNISGGTFNFTGDYNGHIFGGSTYKGTAEGNIIDISGAETVINKYVYGGHGKNANKNEVKISNGTLNGVVYGSRVNDGEATENSVQISGGTINSVVYGGYSLHIGDSSTSKANDNKVVISGGTINSYVVGGAGYEAKDNKIIIKQGIDKAASLVNARLEGNSKETMNATDNNSLIIENLGAGTIIGSVKNFNSISFGDVALGTTSYLTVNDGSLNGTAITAESLTGEGYLISGVSTEGVDVSAIQGDAGKDKFAEKSYGIEYAISGGTSVDVKANSIYVKAGAPDEVKAVAGVISDNGAVIKGNGALNLAGTETVASGAVVAGAYAKAGNAANGTVNIKGNVGSKAIYAGYTAGTGAVSGNTINITGTANVAAADLYGGNGSNVNGNTLNLADWTADTKKIQSVNGFATINLGTVNGVNITNASNLNGTTITVSNTVGAGELISGNFAKEGITVTGFNSVASTESYNKAGNVGVTPVSGLSSKIETVAGTTKVSLVNEASQILAGSYVDAQGVAHDAANKTLVLATTPSDKTELAGAYAVGSQAATSGTVNIKGNIGTAENKATIYAGYSENGAVSGNTVKLIGPADASNVNIVGSNKDFVANANNVLDVTGWTAASKTINSVDKINSISFGDVALGGTYLTINGGSLNGTVITAGKLSGEGDLISGISTTGVNVDALKGEAGKDKVTALSNGVQYAVAGGTAVTVNETSIHVKADNPDTVKAVAGVFYGDDGKPEKGKTNGVLSLGNDVTSAEGVIYAGAYAKKGKASGGTVKLTDNFEGTVYGGYSENNGGTENNTLEIDGSKSVTATAIKQVDTINVTGNVAKGAEAALKITDIANFEETDINIAGLDLEGAVKDTTKYNVISNAIVEASKVAIKGLATVDGDVVKANIVNKDVTNGLTLTYGGKVVTGSYTDEAGAVTANGGVLKVSAIGAPEEGVIYAGAYSTKASPSGIVDLDASFAGKLYGGYKAGDGSGSGTLNVRGAGLVVNEIANFNTINFFVPAELAKDGTVLKVESDVNIAGAKVNAGINNQSALDVGDEITLLEAVSLDATGIVAGKVTENDFVDYDMNIEAANNQLKAKITSKGISNENSKSPVETIAGGLVMLNMGADQLAGKGFENAAEAVALEKAAAPNSMTTFASVGGNKVKAKTGSHVDLKGWNFNMGLAKEIDNKSGKLLIAPLAEYGRGSYDSYIDSGVHAEGTSKYWGVGVMARQTNDSGFYYEASLVGGKSTNDYNTKDIGTGISYDTSAMYMTAHLGTGKIVELGEKDKLNYYGKFFYSRLGSDDVTLSNGAKYSFDASESKRVCLGGRWTRELNAMSKLYAGMAWQYEFDAESRATVNGKTAQAPTMKGHTGIFELGWNVKPNNAKFDIDMSFLGYTGKQKGGSLNVNMNWKF